jgi:hypothetical protein
MKYLTLKSAFITLFIISSTCPEELARKSWPHKLIFSDTPEIGKKWHGGVRMNDIVVWDLNLNVYDWCLVDFLWAGISGMKGENNEEITDRFILLSIKSKPFFSSEKFKWGVYKASGGIKFFSAEFAIESAEETNEDFSSDDASFMVFITQGLERNRHYFNMFSSLSFREKTLSSGKKKTSTTYYLTPGYRYRISENWNFALENYMTNAEQLPIKILQWILDADQVEFWNPDRKMYSFMFWGFNYTRKHLRIDLNLANHISFQGPIMPVLGIGWYF